MALEMLQDHGICGREQLTKLKARASMYDPAIFYWYFNGQLMGIMSTHVDDFCWGGEECFVKNVIEQFRSLFLTGSECDTTFKYVGLCMTQQDGFSIKMDQISYIESIKPVPVFKQESIMRHKPLNKNELKQFRSVIGQLGWAAGQTRPDIAFDCCELSSSVKHATTEALLRANKVLSRAKSGPVVLSFKDMGDLSTAKFVCFNDSSFGNLCDDGSQDAYVIFLEGQNGNCSPLMWQSKKLCRVVRRTMAAETLSQVEAAEACFWLSDILKEILLESQDKSPLIQY